MSYKFKEGVDGVLRTDISIKLDVSLDDLVKSSIIKVYLQTGDTYEEGKLEKIFPNKKTVIDYYRSYIVSCAFGIVFEDVYKDETYKKVETDVKKYLTKLFECDNVV